MEFWKNLCLFLIAIPIAAEAADFDYSNGAHGPANWHKNYPKCHGTLQSPINYKTSDIMYNQSLGTIVMEGYGSPQNLEKVNLLNNGHTLQVGLYKTQSNNISGSGLPGKFALAQLHFHWGNSSSEGSEHQDNGAAYPVEVHFVHYNTKYNNLSTALPKKDGLAVLAVFFQVASSDNAALKPILDYAANVTTAGKVVAIPQFNLRNIMPANIDEFYRNNGSLTTPPCYESVTWTEFKNVMTISEKQLNIFRSLKKEDGQPLVKNFRPIQATNKRIIYATFAAPDVTTPAPTSTATESGTEALDAALLTIVLCALVNLFLKPLN